jgi:integration host factor subunit beta
LSLSQALAEGRRIEMRGFGTFQVVRLEARVGRNPKTGARVDIPVKGVPRFKASKQLLVGNEKTSSSDSSRRPFLAASGQQR